MYKTNTFGQLGESLNNKTSHKSQSDMLIQDKNIQINEKDKVIYWNKCRKELIKLDPNMVHKSKYVNFILH